VVVNHGADAVAAIERVRPDVYVKGIDYAQRSDAALEREIAAVEACGGAFHVTHTEKWSSSRILTGERFDDDVVAYLESCRQRGFLDRILAAFDKADRFKIAFVGETIIDEYRYVAPLGRPPKEFCLATVETKTHEVFQGGVIAASRHVEWPGAQIVTHEHQTLRKTRYVDVAFNRKLFEVYSDRDLELTTAQRALLQVRLSEACRDCDVVVTFDFGHGLLGEDERDILQHEAKHLAVNAQTNTGNFGFNPVTRYGNADCVCVDEPEARLATGMQQQPVHHVIAALARKIVTGNIIVTHGRNGCLAWRSDEGFPRQVPAFATNGIDTMGAGDAFLAACAPLVATGLELEAAAFVGNVAGAIKVGIVGHQRHVTRDELVQTIEALLK
jgi:bifunctional ADP-heptose synthase (sugar kinase/adenylyltransferase)